MKKWTLVVGCFGLLLLIVGWVYGLAIAPAERHMGDVMRIMYAHVPTAWVGMLSYTIGMVFACMFLWGGKPRGNIGWWAGSRLVYC